MTGRMQGRKDTGQGGGGYKRGAEQVGSAYNETIFLTVDTREYTFAVFAIRRYCVL